MADLRLLSALAPTCWPVVIDPVDGIDFDISGWGLYRLNEYLAFGLWFIRWDYSEEPPDEAISWDFHHVLRGALVVLAGGSTTITISRFGESGFHWPVLVPAWPYMLLSRRRNGKLWPQTVERLAGRRTSPRVDYRLGRWLGMGVCAGETGRDIREALQILGEGRGEGITAQSDCSWAELWKVSRSSATPQGLAASSGEDGSLKQNEPPSPTRLIIQRSAAPWPATPGAKSLARHRP